MRTLACRPLLIALVLVSFAGFAQELPTRNGDRPPHRPRTRVIAGDLCATAVPLGRGETIQVDLCQAWNDYDPGAFSCSPCALPGPEIVALLEGQSGEAVNIGVTVLSGAAEVHLYLATDCDDPAGSCLAATATAGASLQYTLAASRTLYLYVDTDGECGEVMVTRHQAAGTARTTFSALKAVYR